MGRCRDFGNVLFSTFLFGLLLTLAPSFSYAERHAQGNTETGGFLVQLRYLPDGQVSKDRITGISAFAERPIRAAPSQWLVLLTDSTSQTVWQQPIPAPNLPHLPIQTDGSRSFSFRVPAIENAKFIRIEDGSGLLRWSLPLVESIVDTATVRQSQVQTLLHKVDAEMDPLNHGRERALAQMRHAAQSQKTIQTQDLGKPPSHSPIASDLHPHDHTCGNTQSHSQMAPAHTSAGSESRPDKSYPFSYPSQIQPNLTGAQTPNAPVPWQPEVEPGAHDTAQPADAGFMSPQSQSTPVTLSGQFRRADGRVFAQRLSIAIYREGSYQRAERTDENGRFQLELEPGRPYLIYVFSPTPYLRTGFEVQLEGDESRQFEIRRGAVISGLVSTSDGGLFDESFSMFPFPQPADDNPVWSYSVGQDGHYELVVEPGRDYRLSFRPPAPYLQLDKTVSVDDDTTLNVEVIRGALLSGQVYTEDGESFEQSFSLWIYQDDQWVRSVPVSQEGVFEVALAAGNYQFLFNPPSPYLRLDTTVKVDGDTNLTFEVARGIVLRGQVQTDTGEAFDQGFAFWIYRNNQWVQSVSVSQAGSFEVILDAGSYLFRFNPPSPFLQKERSIHVTEDRSIDIRIIRGRLLAIDAIDEAGAPVEIGTAAISQDDRRQFHYPSASSFEILARRGVPGFLSVQANDSAFSAATMSIDGGSEDLSLTVVLERKQVLHGKTVDSEGDPLPWAELRFYKGGRFVDSALSIHDGSYNIRLPAGTYSARITLPDPGRYDSKRRSFILFDQIEETVTISEHSALEQDFVFSNPLKSIRFALAPRAVSFSSLPVRVYRDSKLVAITNIWAHSNALIKPGTYDLKVHVAGHGWVTVADIAIDRDQNISLDDYIHEAQTLWVGTLRSPQGHALPDFSYRLVDSAQSTLAWLQTDEQGRFQLPMDAGLYAHFGGGPGHSPESGLLMRTVALNRPATLLEEDIVLEALEFHDVSMEDSGVQLLYGTGNTENAVNVIMLANGYTVANETFEDVNGNGVWDGVLYVDFNNNGVWDPGEPWAVYGDRAAPTQSDAGTDISADNEPFEDLNGDGYPSFDDRTAFEMNARSFIQATLGAHIWEDYREQFNFFVYFTPSNQAGMTVRNNDENILIQRDTFFSGTLDLRRNLLSADYQLAREVASEVLPEFDQIVLFLNQPVPSGRANSFITYNGGMLVNRPDSTTPSHEFGHSIGFLADEYIEATAFPDFFAGLEPSAFNVTTLIGSDNHPWRHWIDTSGHTEEPAIRGEPGVGLFTGGFYRPGGVFRPSQRSKMGAGSIFFNAPSEYATRKRIANPVTLTGAWYDPSTAGQGFNFQFSPVGFFGYYYGYDNEGQKLWLLFDLHKGPLRIGQTIEVQALAPESGFFDAPGSVRAWGDLSLQIESCDRAKAELRSTDGVYRQSFDLHLLATFANVEPFSCFLPPEHIADETLLTGSWYDPITSGQGWNLLVMPFGVIGYFYGYDSHGNALWLATDGIIRDVRIGEPATVGLVRGRGGSFESPVPPEDLEFWGEATFIFDNCRSGSVLFEGLDGEFFQDLVQLAGVAGLPKCE